MMKDSRILPKQQNGVLPDEGCAPLSGSRTMDQGPVGPNRMPHHRPSCVQLETQCLAMYNALYSPPSGPQYYLAPLKIFLCFLFLLVLY